MLKTLAAIVFCALVLAAVLFITSCVTTTPLDPRDPQILHPKPVEYPQPK